MVRRRASAVSNHEAPSSSADLTAAMVAPVSFLLRRPSFRHIRCYDVSMTSLDKADQIADRDLARVRHGEFWRELAETIRLAAPMALTQLSQIAMMTTDLAFIGRLGGEAVAAAALAGTVYWVSFTFGMGLMSAVAPLAAHAYGAGEVRLVRRSLRAGLWTALVVSLPIMAFSLRGEEILLALGQAPMPAHLAQQYLFGLALGVAPALWFIAVRGFMGAVNRPEPVLWITLAAIPANALLVYLLIYGHWGLPRLGLFGAGLATTLVNFLTFVAAMWFATRREPFTDYRVLTRFWRLDWSLTKQLFVIGAPISIALLLEFGLFSAAALLMGRISTTAIAAHQIALQVAAILFMIPYGISLAATVRVGHALGRNDADGVRRAGIVAMLLGIALGVILTVIEVVSRFAIARFFLGEGEANADATVELAATLLLVGATFFITDGLQTIAAGALRGMKDTGVPLLFAAISYWLIGFTLCCWLGFFTPFGAIGIWLGLSIGTLVYAMLLVFRFRLLARRLAKP
jgi:multidrug resistance protein, MATE family